METIKKCIGYVLAPLAFIAGFIYVFLGRRSAEHWKAEAEKVKREKELNEAKAKVSEAKSTAKSSRDKWDKFKRGE